MHSFSFFSCLCGERKAVDKLLCTEVCRRCRSWHEVLFTNTGAYGSRVHQCIPVCLRVRLLIQCNTFGYFIVEKVFVWFIDESIEFRQFLGLVCRVAAGGPSGLLCRHALGTGKCPIDGKRIPRKTEETRQRALERTAVQRKISSTSHQHSHATSSRLCAL